MLKTSLLNLSKFKVLFLFTYKNKGLKKTLHAIMLFNLGSLNAFSWHNNKQSMLFMLMAHKLKFKSFLSVTIIWPVAKSIFSICLNSFICQHNKNSAAITQSSIRKNLYKLLLLFQQLICWQLMLSLRLHSMTTIQYNLQEDLKLLHLMNWNNFVKVVTWVTAIWNYNTQGIEILAQSSILLLNKLERKWFFSMVL